MPIPSDLDTSQVAPLTAQSVATRARLIATAERLFAERGIEGVGLSEINLAAGQRNKNASHYHFGEKTGLLRAIFDKHLPGIILRRERLLDEAEAQGDRSVAGVVRALLYPLAEKLFDRDGGRNFLRVNAQLAASHAAVLNQSGADVFHIGPVYRLQAAMTQFLGHLPKTIAQQRVTLATSLMLNGLADHARLLENSSAKNPAADTEILIRNLEDCLVALCMAPASAAVTEALRKAGQPAARTSITTTKKAKTK